jgi:hypothetical protein
LWKPSPSGHLGAQRKFSDHAIETALALRLVFKLPLRQAEGFLRSVLVLMGVALRTGMRLDGQAKSLTQRLVPVPWACHFALVI